jgi:DNA-binding response OmpR family regulator
MQQHILLVDDEPHILGALRERFERDGFRVTAVATGAAALRALGLAPPPADAPAPDLADFDCLILDLMLPDTDGFEVLRALRQAGQDLPVIVLTARSDDVDKIVGLELGADDYVVKPFNPRELVARVRALLRRMAAVQALRAQLAATVPPDAPLAPGGLQIDAARRLATFHGAGLDLRPKEFDLLALLAAHPGQIFTRETLLNRIWGYDSYIDPRTVDVHIRRLREKLLAIAPDATPIETERGVGYRFRG